MQVRFQNSPKETAAMSTQETRVNFLIQDLMVPGEIKLTYSHYDREIVGGVVPTTSAIFYPMKGN
jgi:4-deoxy-L-threo-5-hexosulose-uronate ketol-isomerase